MGASCLLHKVLLITHTLITLWEPICDMLIFVFVIDINMCVLVVDLVPHYLFNVTLMCLPNLFGMTSSALLHEELVDCYLTGRWTRTNTAPRQAGERIKPPISVNSSFPSAAYVYIYIYIYIYISRDGGWGSNLPMQLQLGVPLYLGCQNQGTLSFAD